MLQPIATVALPNAAPGALTLTADPAAVPFADLLGLISQSLFAGLPENPDAALLADTQAEPAGGTQDAMAAMIAMLFQAGTRTRPDDVALTGATTSTGTEPSQLSSVLASLQKKLPLSPADLAVLEQTLGEQATPLDPDITREVMDLLDAGADKTSGVAVPARASSTVTALAAGTGDASQAITPQAAAHLAAREVVAADTSGRMVTQIHAPLGSQAWQGELSDRLTWMVGRNAQSAEIILNPPSLGSIEVRLNLNLAGNEAGAQFFSANASVRDALESAFPRLRELMAGVGINLGQASVSQESFSGSGSFARSDTGDKDDDAPATLTGMRPIDRMALAGARGSGLVDLYI
jgi:flagellar hook-length control protein FliK